MADHPSGPQASTAVGSSSPDGPLRARLPQAQAENILASLAGRPSAPSAPVHNGHVPARPAGVPLTGAEPRAQAPRAGGRAWHCYRRRTISRELGQAPVWRGPTAKPQSGVGPAKPQSGVSPAKPKAFSARSTVGGTDHGGPGGAAAGQKGTDPYSNDILPDKAQGPLPFPAALRPVSPAWRSRACSPSPGWW